jgi:hypothetical protein
VRGGDKASELGQDVQMSSFEMVLNVKKSQSLFNNNEQLLEGYYASCTLYGMIIFMPHLRITL